MTNEALIRHVFGDFSSKFRIYLSSRKDEVVGYAANSLGCPVLKFLQHEGIPVVAIDTHSLLVKGSGAPDKDLVGYEIVSEYIQLLDSTHSPLGLPVPVTGQEALIVLNQIDQLSQT